MVPKTSREGRLPDGVPILIRPYEVDDVEAAYRAVRESVAEVARWMPWCHEGYSLADARTWGEARPAAWESGSEYDFLIVEAASGEILGCCGLNHIRRDYGFANLGYWVRTSWTGRGVASTAVRLVAEFGFRELGLHRVEIVAAVGNHASQRAAQKAGATREGVLRNRLVLRDQVHDAVMFSLVPQDFNS